MKFEIMSKCGDRVIVMNLSPVDLIKDNSISEDQKKHIFSLDAGDLAFGEFLSGRKYCIRRVE